MTGSRIIYQNWIVELGYDPASQESFEDCQDYVLEMLSSAKPEIAALTTSVIRDNINERERIRQLQEQVREAISQLSEDEHEFLNQFYFIGKSYRTISEQTGRAVHKLEMLHKRALRRLKNILQPYAERQWDLSPLEANTSCPICNSMFSMEIDRLIADRDPRATWRPIIRMLREKYDIRIQSPQVLVGHEKYHCRTSG